MTVDNAWTIKESRTKFPQLTTREVASIKVPTMVMRGEKSAKWDMQISGNLAAAILGSESVMVSNAGHFPLFENPKEFNLRLSDFLARNG